MKHYGWAVLAAMVALSGHAGAQSGRPCALEFRGVVRGGVLTTAMRVFSNPDGSKRTFISGGVDATCAGQGNRLLADSAEHYADRGELVLIRRVQYTDASVRMTSDQMVYYTDEERLHATGTVRGTTQAGTRFAGPEMTYLRERLGLRSASSWQAPGRPTVWLVPRPDSTRGAEAARSAVADTVRIVGQVVSSENDSLVWAVGDVRITRTDLVATADSTRLDQGIELIELRRGPKIVSTGERTFTMVANDIDLWSKQEQLERVRGHGRGRIDADSLVLRADTLDLRLVDEAMDRVQAWGGRAHADGTGQQMEADSLDLRLPRQQLEEVHAVGRAISRSAPDSLTIRSGESDWIAGDTIIARFERVPARQDTTESTRLREVVAVGSARSFYQVAARDGSPAEPNINYSRGRRITVNFTDGAVQDVRVEERASGLYLEAPKVRGDSLRAPSPPPAARRIP
jgi:lipopolysaccharide export system protein LptA